MSSALYKSASFLQNKANFKMGNINISTARTKAYANEQRTMSNEHYSKQTQSNPIPLDFFPTRQKDSWGILGERGGMLLQACTVPILPIVDFYADWSVEMKDFSKLAQYWGQDEPSVDIGPMPWGDGVVDIQDLAVLLEYWLSWY